MNFLDQTWFLRDFDIPDELWPSDYASNQIQSQIGQVALLKCQSLQQLYTINEMDFYRPEEGKKVQNEKEGIVMIGKDWFNVFFDIEFKKILKRTLGFVAKERSEFENYQFRYDHGENDDDVKLPIFPPERFVFTWTWYCSPWNVTVIILGEHPHCFNGQDHGLAFSLYPNYPDNHESVIRKVFEAVRFDCGPFRYNDGSLINWAAQGVLLLNRRLTVREGEPDSHKDCGWDIFTNNIIAFLSVNANHLVFMLWGDEADSNKTRYLIDEEKHLVLTADYPTKSGGNFKRCKHFSKANEFLTKCRLPEVNWRYL